MSQLTIWFTSDTHGYFYDTDFIAEDLGYMTPKVRKLLADSGLPEDSAAANS